MQGVYSELGVVWGLAFWIPVGVGRAVVLRISVQVWSEVVLAGMGRVFSANLKVRLSTRLRNPTENNGIGCAYANSNSISCSASGPVLKMAAVSSIWSGASTKGHLCVPTLVDLDNVRVTRSGVFLVKIEEPLKDCARELMGLKRLQIVTLGAFLAVI